MKHQERKIARDMRQKGSSLSEIQAALNVSKGSVSVWVRDIELSTTQRKRLYEKGHRREAVELRRKTRLINEQNKREQIINDAKQAVGSMSPKDLWLIGVMLYWAEGGKTQRMVRFSNGDPEMIKIMMRFFRRVCLVPESKFRGYIHIHPHLDHINAEAYWSEVTKMPLNQFFKTYHKPNKSSQSKKDSLPNGVLDIYVMDTKLFFTIVGWAKGIFLQSATMPKSSATYE